MKNKKIYFIPIIILLALLILLILLLEYIFDFNMPNLYEDFEYSKSIRAFFWNQNDLAVVLVFFSWIIMYNQKVRFIIKVLYIFIVLLSLRIGFYCKIIRGKGIRKIGK